MYILGKQRDSDVVGAFNKYQEFLENNKNSFPKNAYKLATSDWFYDFKDDKCPHDSWLESISINEPSTGDRNESRKTEIKLKLMGAYHNGYIEIIYPEVYSYQFGALDVSSGHRDWRYDEFRLSEQGHLIHEIEWCDLNDTARWVIVANDIDFKWFSNEPR